MARKLAACGTYAAARRHERRGETMDDACAEALRAYRADRQAARRSTLEHVVARTPGDLTVLPDGWTIWDGILYDDRPRGAWAARWESHIPEYAQTQVRLVDYPDYAALTGRHGSTVTVAAEVRLADLVAQWHADDPLVAARINMLDGVDRADVLRVLGHGTWQTTTPSPDLDRIVTVHVSEWVEWDDDDDTPVAVAADGLRERMPWADTTTYVSTVDLVRWVAPPAERGPIVRAATGTPVPDGWTVLAQSDLDDVEAQWRPHTMPLSWDSMRAVEDHNASMYTGVRVVVIAPTGEVWCGAGGAAESLGVFTDATVMAAQIADRCDTPSVRRWHATPTVHIYHAATPGWASLDGLTPETVPLHRLRPKLVT